MRCEVDVVSERLAWLRDRKVQQRYSQQRDPLSVLFRPSPLMVGKVCSIDSGTANTARNVVVPSNSHKIQVEHTFSCSSALQVRE